MRYMEDFLLVEVDTQTLQRNTIRGFPNTRARQHLEHTCRVNRMVVVPLEPRREIMFKFNVTTTEGSSYQSVLVFGDIEFKNPETFADKDQIPDDWVSIETPNGPIYIAAQITVGKNNTRAKCGCLDFFWRFAKHNRRDKSLYGRHPGRYVKRTNRPPVNPMRVSGMCKHLWACVSYLEDQNIVSTQ